MELRGKVIFVVSDDAKITHPLREFLLQKRFQVIVFDNPKHADVYITKSGPPDAVVVDSSAADVMCLLPLLKSWARATPVVVLSNIITPELSRRYAEAGTCRVVLKTVHFSVEKLVNTLVDALQSAKEQRAILQLFKHVSVANNMMATLVARTVNG